MKIIYIITRYLGYIAALVLAAMMILTVVDIVGRFFFNHPIGGVTELTSLMLVVIVGLSLGWCALERGHVKVDLVMDRLPQKAQYVIDNFLLIATFLLFVVITWRTFVETTESESSSSILRLPLTPFQWFFSIGLLLFCICILIIIIENFVQRSKK